MAYFFNHADISFYCRKEPEVGNCSDVQAFAKVEEGKFVIHVCVKKPPNHVRKFLFSNVPVYRYFCYCPSIGSEAS